ncbi:MAG: HPr family phosphocarrier protein [Lachnospiraceae bacterium]|nr:HPr family phosphocarrier protein [Lachnospiraceae bacterium]
MQELQVSLNTIDKVKSFVDKISEMNGEFNLVAGRYVIDAKSIMGIFSLDISKPLLLQVQNIEDQDVFDEMIQKYAL